MYQSRLHATNGIISIAVDALNGEILELVREKTGDNVRKNHVQKARAMLDGVLFSPDGQKRFTVPRYMEIRKDPSLTPAIEIRQEEGEAEIRIEYPALVSSGERVEISANVRIRLPKGDCRSFWSLCLDNRTGLEADDIAFPALDGLWIGESYRENVLVYPHFAGCRIVNPTAQLASEPEMITWKWQEYLYRYKIGQETGTLDDRGAWVRRLNYSGEASMLWMDLCDGKENAGLYLSCRNAGRIMKSLRMESFGTGDPGVGMAILHRPALRDGAWSSEECVLALHEGDWHWAADDYRAYIESLPSPHPESGRPEWFEKSAGLMAHYDFQYQTGGIVHRFADIPRLYEEAERMGIRHLLLSGWNTDGFDYGFPHYTPNPDLGTEQELKDAVAEVHRRGGHIAFYINSRLCNTAFSDQQERIAKSAVMKKDGNLWIEKYGSDAFSFATLCINEPSWRQELARTVHFLTHEIGADSMYLDQFAMGTSMQCYHPGHEEHRGNPSAWNQGYVKLLGKMIPDYDPEGMALLIEGCNDLFGPSVSGQLISQLHCPFESRMPQVYKYTFPDQILMDMMNPRRHSAMRPEHVARHSTALLYDAFTMGSYFWCYDLEWDNNWRQDPEQLRRLTALVALRNAWLERYGHGRFRDTVGVEPDVGTGEDWIRRFDLPFGALIACASEQGLQGRIDVATEKEVEEDDEVKAEVLTLESPEPVPVSCTVPWGKAAVRLELPKTEAAIVVLRFPWKRSE